MKKLPDTISITLTDKHGVTRTKPLKELLFELILNYNQLIEYLKEMTND